MSHPGDNDIIPGSINNQQHPYLRHPRPDPVRPRPVVHHPPAPPPHPHPQSQPRLPQNGLHQPHHPYFVQAPSFRAGSDTAGNANIDSNISNPNIHPLSSTLPVIPPYPRSTFDLNAPSYAAVPSGVLVNQIPQEHDTSTASAVVLSDRLTWGSEPGTSSQQKDGIVGAAQSYRSAMRYIKGPLDVLNAEQYDDGYPTRHGPSKSEVRELATGTATTNPKKRARKGSQMVPSEPVEEVKRARGRPRLDTGDHQDMKERRKEQIRLAQRAYRNRKETAITDLEAKVAGLEASNAEVKATFQSLLMEYVEKHAIDAQLPELGRRLEQFQSVLTQRFSDTDSSRNDETASDVKTPASHTMQSAQAKIESQSVRDEPTPPATQQPRQLFGGIIVTHEPESQVTGQELVSNLDTSLEDGGYTIVRMANSENASFGVNLSFFDSSMPAQWPLAHWESLPMPASGAYMERTFGRRLHRRTTEKALKLLTMENPPYDTMHRVFGFVRNYASMDNISQRIKTTLTRSADEDLDAYAQPFHHIGGAGTHFTSDAKTISYPAGAPFPNTGFGMGPFNEKTTAVRDDLLDVLQRTNFPGWQGEWFDSYEVEQFLVQKSINLPQGEDGYVEIPPGEFYDNPLDKGASSPRSNLQGSAAGKVAASDFDASPGVVGELSMHAGAEQTITRNAPYPSSVSTIDSMLPITATADMWPPISMTSDFLGIPNTMSGNMSSLLAYQNAVTAPSFPDSSLPFGYASPSAMNLVNGQNRTKRVWFSVEKFIESLGSKGTCVGRGPAFRKKDIVIAFWEAVKPGPP
ncbi:hypothetical protein F4802DRAFT_594250 [Xylaria palmicola]|nr:hypothetical protein F4802DRAFT_594250 [Xylaria palmicola]